MASGSIFLIGPDPRFARVRAVLELLERLTEILRVTEAVQLGKGLGLDLTGPLARDVELLTDSYFATWSEQARHRPRLRPTTELIVVASEYPSPHAPGRPIVGERPTRRRSTGTTSRVGRLTWMHLHRVPDWRREALRTTLWVIPAVMVAGAVALFALTYALDRAAVAGHLTFAGWVNAGGADAARQVLIGLAAAVITVAGVVFSVTILALQLASQQFGPRMLRNFIRDLGTQASLGAFVATFVYAMLTLASVGQLAGGEFVPHLSVTVALALTLGDLGVLIYFINHVAKSIQLTSVVSGIGVEP